MTLNTENNNKLSQLLSKGFERTVVWNEYKSKIETVNVAANYNNFKRTTYETNNIKRNANTQEEDIIYQEQKLKIIIS